MSEQMEFPETFEKFAKEYGFKDKKEIYTNGSDLIQVFRVKQWIEHNKMQVLDKIRAEVMDCLNELDETENEIEYSGFNLLNEISSKRSAYKQCIEIIDKYKAESEGKND